MYSTEPLYKDVCANCKDCTPHDNPCPPPPCDGCLSVSQPIVLPSNGVTPCNQSGFVEITSNGCAEDVIFSVLSHDDELTNVSFNDNNLMFESTTDCVPGEYYKIRYKATCPSSGFEVQGVAHIGITDLCSDANCGENEVCDPCTGECNLVCVDISAEDHTDRPTHTKIDLIAVQ